MLCECRYLGTDKKGHLFKKPYKLSTFSYSGAIFGPLLYHHIEEKSMWKSVE